MPITYAPGLPPVPAGLTVSLLTILREELQEDTIQALLTAIYNGGRGQAYYNVQAYGADPNGGVDSSDAFNEATLAAELSHGIVYVPLGRYILTDRWNIASVRGLEVVGDGPACTHITWQGASGEDMCRIYNAQLVNFHGIDLVGNPTGANTPRSCLHLSFNYSTIGNVPPAAGDYAYTTALLNVWDVWLGRMESSTGLPNTAEQALRIATENVDYNNSEHVFRNVHIDGAEDGVYINQTQAKTLKFYDCHINNAIKGVNCPNGAFTWYGGSINCVQPDKEGIMFEIGAPNDPILIEGVQSEGSGRILRSGAGVLIGAGWPVTIRNSRIAGNLANPDGVMIEFGARGPLVVENNIFDSWDEVAGTPLQFKLTSSVGATAADIRNNMISGTDSYQNSIIKTPAATGVRENGNIYYNTGAGSFFQRRHAGQLSFVQGDTAKTWTFDVPVHEGAAGAQIYVISPIISARGGGAAQTISTVAKTATGFTVTLSAVLAAGETITVDWQLEWM